MPYTYGTANAHGMPVTVEFSFNGSSTPWGTANLYSMSPLDSRAEAVDGAYAVSDLDVELIDTNGSIWGSLGNGTTAFNKEFSATVYLGGQMDYVTYGPSSLPRLKKVSNTSSATHVVHQGVITDVSKRDRLVRIKSQNNLRRLSDLEWRFPFTAYRLVQATYGIGVQTPIGSYVFYPSNLATWFPNSLHNVNEESDKFELFGAILPTDSNAHLEVDFPPIAGRGTLGRLTGYSYPGTAFYEQAERVIYTATWLGTYSGTISTDVEANTYGYSSAAVAEAAKIAGPKYIVNKTRLSVKNGTLPTGINLYLQQNLTLSETPANLFRELISGHCVTPYFGTLQIESSSFATSQRNTVYQGFSQRIAPDEPKVLPYLKNLLDSSYAVFAVNPQNQFEYRAYGPRNLNQAIEAIGGTDILSCEVSNTLKDAINRVVVKYAYSIDDSEYKRSFEIKGTPWDGTTDIPKVIESKWVTDIAEARMFGVRVLARYKQTIPSITLKTSLKYSGRLLGSLISVTDEDSGLLNKTMEITSYSKDFTDSKEVTLSGVDGESLYNRRGFGFWMAGTVMPPGAVSGTSTLGWGTAGTMANINTTIFGSQFVWW